MRATIYTPTYNTGMMLYRTYESIRRQSVDGWEWIICDDGSEKETTLAINQIAYQDLRVRPYFYNRCGSIGMMKQRCVDNARHEILIELDHDDQLMPTAVSSVLNAFRDDAVGMAYSNFAEVSDVGESHEYHFAAWQYRTTDVGWAWVKEAISPNVYAQTAGLRRPNVAYWTLMPNHLRAYRRAHLESIGGYDATLEFADDYDLFLRMFKTYKIAHIDELLYLYRWGANTWLGQRNAELQKRMAQVRARYPDICGEWSPDDTSLT